MQTNNNFSGYIPSPPDERDYKYEYFGEVQQDLPKEFEHPLPPWLPVHQGSTAMCFAISLASVKEVQEFLERGKWERFSPAFIYANRTEWEIENANYRGMNPRYALGMLQKDGVCRWNLFPDFHMGWGYLVEQITKTRRKAPGFSHGEAQKISFTAWESAQSLSMLTAYTKYS